jgi:hypothetical protein
VHDRMTASTRNRVSTIKSNDQQWDRQVRRFFS